MLDSGSRQLFRRDIARSQTPKLGTLLKIWPRFLERQDSTTKKYHYFKLPRLRYTAIRMGFFSKKSASKKVASEQPKALVASQSSSPSSKKYVHVPQHAYIDALNCVPPSNTHGSREALRAAALRRGKSSDSTASTSSSLSSGQSRSSVASSMSTPSTHSRSSSSSNRASVPMLSNWERRKLAAQQQKDTAQHWRSAISNGSASGHRTRSADRRAYRASPLSCSMCKSPAFHYRYGSPRNLLSRLQCSYHLLTMVLF